MAKKVKEEHLELALEQSTQSGAAFSSSGMK
jgi:hypothetical protein